MSTDPTLPLPGAGAPGRFPPPTDPWSTPVPPQRAPEAPAADAEPAPGPPTPPPSSGLSAFTWGDATPSSGAGAAWGENTPPPGPSAPASGPPLPGPPIPGPPVPRPPVSRPPVSGAPVAASPYPVGLSSTAGAVLVQIGEIAVTSSTVRTPAGEIPLRGTTWHVADYWQSEQRTPRWAVVAAIVGFCVLTVLSLLFLLVKETVHRGTVQVTVGNGPWQYVARIPVTSQYEVQQINERVNYVRSLAVG